MGARPNAKQSTKSRLSPFAAINMKLSKAERVIVLVAIGLLVLTIVVPPYVVYASNILWPRSLMRAYWVIDWPRLVLVWVVTLLLAVGVILGIRWLKKGPPQSPPSDGCEP